MSLKKAFLAGMATAALGAGILAVSSISAAAYVACNGSDCWHTESREHAPGVSFSYHPDDWYFHRHWDDGRYRWRDYHEGHGYYRDGVWITL